MDRIIESMKDFLFLLPGLLIALSAHEFSHGYIAYKLGDNTARNLGRLTMNPLKHIDPFGLLAMILVHFGWAKPVPVNMRNFKKPRRDIALVSLAGPVSNLLLGFIGLLLLNMMNAIVYRYLLEIYQSDFWQGMVPNIYTMIGYFIRLNVGLGIFNLIPLPPLDGSKIPYSLLPGKLSLVLMRYERYLSMFVFFLLITGWVVTPLMEALVGYIINGMQSIISLIPFL